MRHRPSASWRGSRSDQRQTLSAAIRYWPPIATALSSPRSIAAMTAARPIASSWATWLTLRTSGHSSGRCKERAASGKVSPFSGGDRHRERYDMSALMDSADIHASVFCLYWRSIDRLGCRVLPLHGLTPRSRVLDCGPGVPDRIGLGRQAGSGPREDRHRIGFRGLSAPRPSGRRRPGRRRSARARASACER